MNRQPNERIVLSKEQIERLFNDFGLIDASYTDDMLLNGQGGVGYGMSLYDIEYMDDNFWEKCHSFIQILFPNPMPSKMHPTAPIIADFSVFDGVFKSSIVKVYSRFLGFLGLYENARAFRIERIREWLKPSNHNILRVTRVLIFLKGVGMIAEMETLRNQLKRFVLEFEESGVLQKGSMDYTVRMWSNV